MEIYAIDDKSTELEKAWEAIENNGHSIINKNCRSRESIMRFAENYHYSQDIGCDLEWRNAIKIAKECNGGIITDMMFRLVTPLGEDDPMPPSGLLIVIHALAAGVPVVVCTDASEVGGHHAKALRWIHDGYIIPARRFDSLPFGWIENKDWDAAVKLLEQLHAKQQEKEVTK